MSEAAAVLQSQVDVQPAETPLTPESWGKLGMWVFLAGDAMSFGGLCWLWRASRQQPGLAKPVTHVRHLAHRLYDVSADL